MAKDTSGDVKIPFGKYKGQAISEIADSKDGLKYLDWILGQEWFKQKEDLFEAVDTYLKNPHVARELAEAIGD